MALWLDGFKKILGICISINVNFLILLTLKISQLAHYAVGYIVKRWFSANPKLIAATSLFLGILNDDKVREIALFPLFYIL